MKKQDENLNIITKVVNQSLTNIRIILFGSRAGNNAVSYSDYDILIIVKIIWNHL